MVSVLEQLIQCTVCNDLFAYIGVTMMEVHCSILEENFKGFMKSLTQD